MADTTLPPLVADLRCAPQAVEIGLDPLGTAAPCQVLVLVESTGLWPPKIEEAADLRDLPPLGPECRVLATRGHDGARQPTLTIWRAGDDLRFTGTDYHVEPGHLPAVLEDLVAGRPLPDDLVDRVEVLGPAPREVLICGHGRRDQCCGSFGIRLLDDATARAGGDVWSGVRVRRCSHTGGHRFAPTGITLPAGRVWAFLDLDSLEDIVAARPTPGIVDHNRGLMALDPWEQVVEGTLYRAVGPAWTGVRPRLEHVDPDPDDASRTYRVTWLDGERERRATVAVRRTGSSPVPVCGAPLDEAKKSSPTFEVVSVEL